MRTKDRKAETEKGAGDRKQKVVHARLSRLELAAIEQAAGLAGVSVSAFMRSLSLHGAGVLPFLTDEDRAVLDLIGGELREIGVNLNGLVRVANRGGTLVDADVSVVVSTLQPALASVALELERYTTRIGKKRSSAR